MRISYLPHTVTADPGPSMRSPVIKPRVVLTLPPIAIDLAILRCGLPASDRGSGKTFEAASQLALDEGIHPDSVDSRIISFRRHELLGPDDELYLPEEEG